MNPGVSIAPKREIISVDSIINEYLYERYYSQESVTQEVNIAL